MVVPDVAVAMATIIIVTVIFIRQVKPISLHNFTDQNVCEQ